MTERDTSRDGLRNRIENTLLNGFRPFWKFVNETPWLARIINRLVITNAVGKLPTRPLRLSTMVDYTSWASLNDHTWFGRYLPPAMAKDHPPLENLAEIYQIRAGTPRLSDRSTLLFPAFAQWFTDGFLMTDVNRLKTRTNHQIDLCQLYGLNAEVTHALRLNDNTPGRRGRLRSIETQTGEWAPPLFDDAGARIPSFEVVPMPVQLSDAWPAEKKHTLFSFGGERANSNLYTASVNTLFLREHNRLCAILEQANPGWDDSRIFETARNINIVLLIKIVVEEYINHISPYWLQLLADPSAAYRANWNRPNWIPVEFNLLYRWHSLIPERVCWKGEMVQVNDCQFDNSRPLADGLAEAFISASSTQAWALGLFNTVEMLHRVELASVQQARDNCLATYNDYRQNAKYPRVTRFEQISSDPHIVAALAKHYGHVDEIEYFVGLFSEDLPPRSAVPPLIGRMVAADAFSHALTNPLLAPAVYNAETFTKTGLEIIAKTTTLAELLRRNTQWKGDRRVSMQWEGYNASAW